jgi:hypothetical protein
MRSILFAAICTVLVASCHKNETFPEYIDRSTFRFLGRAMLKRPPVVALKQIHLELGGSIGKTFEVKGLVSEVGAHGSHIVLADEGARLLVVASRLDAERIKDASNKIIKVIGSVSSGVKGLPVLHAREMYVIPVAGG